MISSPYKYESVYLSYDVNYTFTIAVGDWVFSEDQKIKEYYQVGSHKSGVRMAEQIPTTARIWSNFFCLIKPFVLCWLQINERNTLNVRWNVKGNARHSYDSFQILTDNLYRSL